MTTRALCSLLATVSTLALLPGCDPLVDADPQQLEDEAAAVVDALHRRIDLRNIPGRHVAAWDAMFALDVPQAQALLADLITEDCTITFEFPGAEFSSPPGVEGWIAVVTGSAQAGGWVPAGPGLPRSIHNAASLNVLEESATAATLRVYIRASHYDADTTVDFSEGIFEYDVVYDEVAETWKIAHLDLTPLSLRQEGGMVLPPVTTE